MSTFHTGRFDQPEQASAWLQVCRTMNGKFFSEVITIMVIDENFEEKKRISDK